MSSIENDEKDRTLFCGNLHPKVTEEILYELFLQAGPLEKVKLVNNKNFSFITFKHPISVPYAIQLMNGIHLFQKPVLLQLRTGASNGSSQSPLMPNINPLLLNMPVTPPQFSNGSSHPSASVSVQNMTPSNTPYHRSASHPNFVSNHELRVESHRNEADFKHTVHGKMKQMSYPQNHRGNLPYNRTSTPDSRFDRSNWNSSFNKTPIVPSPIQMQSLMMATASWQNLQLAFQRRF